MPAFTFGTAEPESRPYCRHCENVALHRCSRFGFLQRVILSRFGYYPWECGLCRREYMIRQRFVHGSHTPRELLLPGDENLLPWRPAMKAAGAKHSLPSADKDKRSTG